jgi:hypothetical protein
MRLLFFRVIFLPLLVFLSFSFPVCAFFWSRTVLFSMARALGWSCSALPGALVSRRSVWYRGALLRGRSQCRCECELVHPCESLASRVPVVPLPLRSKHIRGTTVALRH